MIQAGNLIVIMDDGFTPMTDGIGFRIIRGVGRHFTMAVGFMTRAMAGAGGRIRSGRHHGFAGVIRMITAVGRRCHLAANIAKAWASFSTAIASAWGLTSV